MANRGAVADAAAAAAASLMNESSTAAVEQTIQPGQTTRPYEGTLGLETKPLSGPFSLRLLECDSAAKVCEILISKLRWFGRLPTPGHLYFVEFHNEQRNCGGCTGSNYSDDYCTTETAWTDNDDCDSILEAILSSQENELTATLQREDHETRNHIMPVYMDEKATKIGQQCFHDECSCMRQRCFLERSSLKSHPWSHSRSHSINSKSSGFLSDSDDSRLELESCKYEDEADSTTNGTEFGTTSADTERRLRMLEVKVDKLVAQISQLCSK